MEFDAKQASEEMADTILESFRQGEVDSYPGVSEETAFFTCPVTMDPEDPPVDFHQDGNCAFVTLKSGVIYQITVEATLPVYVDEGQPTPGN